MAKILDGNEFLQSGRGCNVLKNQTDRLLIISNNALSNARANGKTLLSFFDALPKDHVAQLYFSPEKPSVSGYSYFQLSDNDVLKGVFCKSKRGRALALAESIESTGYQSRSSKLKTPLMRTARELLWHNRWLSSQLIDWLDEFSPTAIFFCCRR